MLDNFPSFSLFVGIVSVFLRNHKWSRAPWCPFLKKNEIITYHFQKLRTKILCVDNVDLYQCEKKYNFKIRLVRGYEN